MTTELPLLIPGPQDAKACDGCTCICPFGWDAHGDRDSACLAAERAAREQADELARLRARVAELETLANDIGRQVTNG